MVKMCLVGNVRYLMLLGFVVTAVLGLSTTNNKTNRIIPITVISGFLGSGKTTLLQHLLENKEGLRIALIVNDVASVNIDSKLISGGMGGAAGMVELQNGCACCSLSDELLTSVSELVTLSDMRGDDQGFHHIVVELSGVADPKAVRSKFQEAILFDMPLMERVRLDTLTTVVDCSFFLQHLKSTKGATPKDSPELFYRDGKEPEEMEDWMNDLPGPLLEALMAGNNPMTAAMAGSAKDGVAELLVDQTETADVVLLNKVDLVEQETSDRIQQIVEALNPRANIVRTTFGHVSPDKILAAAGGKGVVEAGVVDDHRDAVDAAKKTGSNSVQVLSEAELSHHDSNESHSHSHSHAHSAVDHTDADSADHSDDHSHSHGHGHDHATDDGTEHSHSHSHSHSHDHTGEDCTDPSHSHSHSHAGIGTYVYRARRPFHPGRLLSLLRHLPISRGLPDAAETPLLEMPEDSKAALDGVLRSKGFVWCADSNVAALYWSHAGSSFDMQCLGRWWATLPRDQWPEEAVSTILEDFDNVNHDEGNTESVGDRRQEIVFIGTDLAESQPQTCICNALDQCLLSNAELATFQSCMNQEDKLRSIFANPVQARVISY